MDATTIRAYRRSTGLTQAQFAELFGVTQPTVCNWETGRSEPAHRYALKLCAMIGAARIRAERLRAARTARQKLDRQRGTLLRKLRLEHDITVDELSNFIGFAPVIVTRWETGEYTMTPPTVREIEKLFRVPLTGVNMLGRR